ncbi:hypothetical protein FHS25_001537 [Rhizobium laguerreae]|uniref:Peptidase C14 caspase domain-containing protein n=1 Tax=Rhizobium laguerreae TaxID=1076926 RepID=A0ABR6G679_9HYPH|nr:caspase family protein [Rhizobium laguerreae]MBB3161088.1 hypothetical protein [Rhizobium laguerreae]OOO51946.1 hypothetical protein BS630_06055 [Rhizobium laguerreae]
MPEKERRIALLLASDDYPDERETFRDLICPANDVNALKSVLSAHEFGDFDAVEVLYRATSADAYERIETHLHECGPDDLFLLYYSGHGWTDREGQLFLTFKNSKLRALRATSIPFDNLKLSLVDPAVRVRRQAIILDCCYAGAVNKSFYKGGAAAHDMERLVSDAQGTVIFAASDAFQTAKEGEDGLSVFTKHFVEGITTGHADPSGEGRITATGMANYLSKKVPSENRQRPRFFGINTSGEIILARGRAVSVVTGPMVAESRLERLIRELGSEIDDDVLSALDRLASMGSEAATATACILALERREGSAVIRQAALRALLSIDTTAFDQSVREMLKGGRSDLDQAIQFAENSSSHGLSDDTIYAAISVAGSPAGNAPAARRLLSALGDRTIVPILKAMDAANANRSQFENLLPRALEINLSEQTIADLTDLMQRVGPKTLWHICQYLVRLAQRYPAVTTGAFNLFRHGDTQQRNVLREFFLRQPELDSDVLQGLIAEDFCEDDLIFVLSLPYRSGPWMRHVTRELIRTNRKNLLPMWLLRLEPTELDEELLASLVSRGVEPCELFIRLAIVCGRRSDLLKEALWASIKHKRITVRMLAIKALVLQELAYSEKRHIIRIVKHEIPNLSFDESRIGAWSRARRISMANRTPLASSKAE